MLNDLVKHSNSKFAISLEYNSNMFFSSFCVPFNFQIFWNTMPGHVKKSDGPDPDPSPWLLVSDELKVKLKSKPYDPKKSCWVPDKATHGYFEGLIESMDGDKVSVKLLDTKEVSIIEI